MQVGVNEVLLLHPKGALVVVLGTQHVSATHGCAAQDALARWGQPPALVLEIDQERFQDLHYRLAHVIHHDTAALLKLAAQAAAVDGVGCTTLLPAALLWQQYQQQFQTVRNEGVPLLLGSMYGADMLQAALAAAAAAHRQQQQQQQQAHHSTTNANVTPTNCSSCRVVLADQPHDITMARFRALSHGLVWGQIGQWLASYLPGSVAHAEAAHLTAAVLQNASTESRTCSSSSSDEGALPSLRPTSDQQQQQQLSLVWSAVQIAVGRLLHLCVQWWSMVLVSRAAWYGQHLHPVFLLVGNPELQQQQQEQGVQGVPEAAAAAVKMLEAAARHVAPAAQELNAVRKYAASLEQQQLNSSSSSDSALSLTRPWWVRLTAGLSGNFTPLGVNFPQQQQQQQHQQQHANHTAAMAYEQAVMADRNAVLADALWHQAEAAAAAAADRRNTSQEQVADNMRGSAAAAAAANNNMQPAVLGVVGMNHLPGIVQEWKMKEQQWQQQQGQYSSSDLGQQQQQQQYEAQRLAAADAVADALEFCVAGSAGLAYLCAVSKITQPKHAAAAATAAAAADMAYTAPTSRRRGTLINEARRFTHFSPRSSVSSSDATYNVYASFFAGQQQQQRSVQQLCRKLAAAVPPRHHLQRIGLLLLPVGVALLPLQLDAWRCQEASKLLQNVAVVNDRLTRQGDYGVGMQRMLRLAGVLPAEQITCGDTQPF